MQKRFFLAFLFVELSLFAKTAPIFHHREVKIEGEEIEAPWLTGPLFAPSSITIPPGHYNIEPYIFAVANTGNYDSDWHASSLSTFWNNSLQVSIQFGLLNWLDISLNPTLFYNYTPGAGKWVIGDLPVAFDIQLYKGTGKPTDWIPALKLVLKETFPIGKYQNLDPQKVGTDVGGGGSWQTAVGLVWGNLVYIGRGHFFNMRLALQYTIPAPVSVKNLNAYGGGAGTRGTVYPAQNFGVDLGMELTLTQNWVFAMDIIGAWTGSTRFKGYATAFETKSPATQFSIAPAIEYNWNGNIGIIFGPWLTIGGRNAVKFESGVFAFNYYH